MSINFIHLDWPCSICGTRNVPLTKYEVMVSVLPGQNPVPRPVSGFQRHFCDACAQKAADLMMNYLDKLLPKPTQTMTSNFPKENCPVCNEPEVEAETPRTVYACGSSDYDQRPGSFLPGPRCQADVLRGSPTCVTPATGQTPSATASQEEADMEPKEIERRMTELMAGDVIREDVWAVADQVYAGEDEAGPYSFFYSEAQLQAKAVAFPIGSNPEKPWSGFRYDPETKTLWINLNLSEIGRQWAKPLRRELLYESKTREFGRG